MMGKWVISQLWLQNPLYKKWLRQVNSDKHKAQCTLCMKDVEKEETKCDNSVNCDRSSECSPEKDCLR